MASKKSGRAAGLAALAGLAYMASQDKGGAKKTSTYAETADREDADMGKAMGTNAGKKLGEEELAKRSSASDFMSEKEPGWMTKSAPTSVVSTPSLTRTAPAKSPSAATPSGAYRGMRSDMKDIGGGRSSGRGGPEAGEGSETKPAGAYRGMRSDMKDVGAGRGGRGGPEAGEEAAYRATLPAMPEGAFRGKRSDMPSSGLGGVRRPGTNVNYENEETSNMKRGGKVKKMASGGMTSSASRRGDGIASKGKTRCKMY